jgi:annexin A7/11
MLFKGMKGLGTDDNVLTLIIGKMTNKEMQAVIAAFDAKYKKHLIDEVSSETSGNFRVALKALLHEHTAYEAELLMQSTKGLGTDDDLLIEMVCTRTPEHIDRIETVYKALYKKDSMKEVKEDVSGDYGKLLLALMTNKRPSPSKDDWEKKKKADAEHLYKAGEKKLGTDEKKWIEIFSTNSREYLEDLAVYYANTYQKSLEKVIEAEFSGNLRKALITLITPLTTYWSEKLYKAMKGMGTNDSELIRIIVLLKENRLREVATHFLGAYKKTLRAWVESETSGAYKALMVEVLKSYAENTEKK